MNNPIRSLMYSRIKALLAQSEGLTNVPHNLTKGQLREQLLIEFFTDILPDRYTVCSGFLVDSFDHDDDFNYPQLDFIVAETTDVPRLVLNREVSLVPVEAARAVVEIKSNIQREDFAQVSNMIDQHNKLRTKYFSSIPDPYRHQVLVYLIGFETSISAAKMRELMQDSAQISGVCIVGQYSLVRNGLLDESNDLVMVKDSPDQDNFDGTTTFLGCFYRQLAQLTLKHTPHYWMVSHLAKMLSQGQSNNEREIVQRFIGKQWYWEAYISETLKNAANKRIQVDMENKDD